MSGDRLLWPRATSPESPIRVRPLDGVAAGSTMGIGDLPHRDARRGVEFSLTRFDIPTVPQLPAVGRGSQLAQTFGDLPGVSFEGARMRVDLDRLELRDPDPVDVSTPRFSGFGGALEKLADGSSVSAEGGSILKWQFLGPISGGVELMQAGVDPLDALEISHVTVRRKIVAIASAIAAASPGTAQICVLNEPHISWIARRSFPLALDEAVDVLSCAMATVQQIASVGVHTCANLDLGVLIEAGPELLSIPAREGVVRGAAHLDRFLGGGGWIAWGAVATQGPVGVTARRAARQLFQLWSELVRGGCDPGVLCAQSIITPSCGLAAHSASDVDLIGRAVSEVASVVQSGEARSMITFGR